MAIYKTKHINNASDTQHTPIKNNKKIIRNTLVTLTKYVLSGIHAFHLFHLSDTRFTFFTWYTHFTCWTSI